MKTIEKMGAQGDVMFIAVDSIPENAVQEQKDSKEIVVAHSETGHNHAIANSDVSFYKADDFNMYLDIQSEYADVVHHRSFDTHETIRLPKGKWQVRRQREYSPEGWRRVED